MLNQSFFQVALPIMVTLVTVVWAATWSQNKRVDDFKESIADLKKTIKEEFDKVNKKLDKFDERIRELELARFK